MADRVSVIEVIELPYPKQIRVAEKAGEMAPLQMTYCSLEQCVFVDSYFLKPLFQIIDSVAFL